MTLHEYGCDNADILVLLHPSGVFWDYFTRVIPLLEPHFHLVIPAIPGYDETQPETAFSSTEKVADELADWLLAHGHDRIAGLFGCSMGGAIALRFLATRRIHVGFAVIDGGITPYELPWLVTRLIAIKDFLLVSLGKIGGLRLLEKVFATDSYSKEDLRYIARVLRFLRFRTIWRSFESCNNYEMPGGPLELPTRLEYWYAEAEARERRKDLAFVARVLPQTEFVVMRGIGHAGMASKRPEEFAGRILALWRAERETASAQR